MDAIKSSNIIVGAEIKSGYIYFDNGVITSISGEKSACDNLYDFGDRYVSAGFIDSHTHGAAGQDYTFCDADGVAKAVNWHLSHGTTSVLPTTLASSEERTEKAVAAISEAKKSGKAKADILGVHIEGPYFSPKQAGAQNPEFLTPPVKRDYVKLIEKFGTFIKKWSYAPELDKNAEFCEYLISRGITPSAGHTDAIFDDMKTAYDKGLRNVTHLYSSTSTITREQGFRRLGVIESAYYFDDMFTELIADGRHVPTELIKLTFKLKGADKVVLVTDSLAVAGSGETSGYSNGVPFIVELGVARLVDRSAFAGSISSMDVLIREVLKAGVSLTDAVLAATDTPARSFGVKKGRIEKGYPADFAVFDKDINVEAVFVGGRKI